MTEVRHQPSAPTRTQRLAAGGEVDAHRHDEHQIVYAGHGVLAVTTDAGSWIAPATRAIWVPAGTVTTRSSTPGWAKARSMSSADALYRRRRATEVAAIAVGATGFVLCVLTALFAPARAIWGIVPTRSSLEQLAEEHLEVRLDRRDDDVRTAALVPHGPGWEQRLDGAA